MSKLKWVAGLLLGVTLAGASAGLGSSKLLQAAEGLESPAVKKPRTDFHGDPLPEGVSARLGTMRLRHLNSQVQPLSHLTVAFSPDGKALASYSLDGSIRVWEAATGKQLYQVQHESDPDCPQQVAFSPDGKLLAATGADGATLWEAASGKKLRHLAAGFGGVRLAYALAFSPDSKTLAMSDGGRGNIKVVEVATGQELRKAKSERHVSSLVYSADGKLLASGVLKQQNSIGDEFGLWDVDTGKMVHQVKGQRGYCAGFAFSADHKTLAITSGPRTTGSAQRMISLWDVPAGKEIRNWPARQDIGSVAFSPDGKSLCTGSYDDGTICLWETATGKPIHPFDMGPVLAIAASGDGRTLAALTGIGYHPIGHNPIEDNAIRLYDATTWKETGLYPHPGSTSIALSGNGRILASGAANGICLWETATGKELWRSKEGDLVHALAFSPDNRTLVSASQVNGLCLWDAATGRQLRQFGDVAARRLAFSADGKTLAVGSIRTTQADDTVVQLWDVTTGKKLGRFLFLPETRSFHENFSHVAFSADGKTLAAGAKSNSEVGASIRAWDIATGREHPAFTIQETYITSVALSPDGRTGVVSSADSDKTRPILLWEVATGKERGRLQGHTGGVASLAVLADGRLASGSSDTTVLIWDLAKPGGPAIVDLDAERAQALWQELASDDAAKAFEAILALSAAPNQAVPLIREHLPPIQAPDPKAVPQLLADLDNDDFNVRAKATTELEKHGEAVEPDLRRVLTGKLSLEMRRRVERLLNRLTEAPTGEELRTLRAVEVLERVGTAEARQALEALAKGAPGVRLTREAQTALKRLPGK